MSATFGLYAVLTVEKDASKSDIKKAYMKLARKYHPDKNPNCGDQFKEITTAYEILSDEGKRAMYDKFGDMMVNGGVTDTQKPADDFPKTKPTIHHTIPMSLEDLYNGKSTKIDMNRTRTCTLCNGKGGHSEGSPCYHCNSTGIVTSYLKENPHHSFQLECKKCHGGCVVFSAADICKHCKGKRTISEKHTFDIYVGRGMRNIHKIVCEKEGVQKPGHLPGDVVFTVEEQAHPVFKLIGLDLHVDVELSLLEALTGNFSIPLTQLDGRELVIDSKPGVVIKPGDVCVVPKEGFPVYRNPLETGDLHVHFSIKFPEEPLTEHKQILEQILPSVHRYIPEEHQRLTWDRVVSKEGKGGSYQTCQQQ